MLLDVSMPVTPRTAAWPGDEPFSCGWTTTKAISGSVNVGRVTTSPHVGTHVDAPFHYDDAGLRVGGLDLDAFVGRALVVDARGASALDARLLRGLDLASSPRILFRTAARADPTAFRRDFPLLTDDALDILESARVKLVGIDAPSVDAVDSRELPIHHALGAARIVNLENLVLDGVEAGAYELFAAPIRWDEADAAPVRALLRR